jgi:hypothetical protein
MILITSRLMDEPDPKLISTTDVITYREGPAMIFVFSTRIRNIIL